MSAARFLEKLLDGAGVDWVPLAEIGRWYGGGTPSKSRLDFWENGTIPWVSPKDMGRRIIDTSEDYISEAAIRESSTKLVPANSIAVVVRSSILDKHLPTALVPVPVTLNQDMKAIIPAASIDPRYVVHLFRSKGDDILRQARKSGGSVASIDSKRLFAFQFPIPCPDNPERSLAIQREIVRILDSFTELTAELTQRKKQYNHYRDQLLTFDEDGVEWRTLGQLVKTIKTGKLNANAMVDQGKYPFFTCDANPYRIDTYAFDTEAIIVSGNGSQVGHINYYNGKFNAYQRTYVLADCADEISIGFLLSYLKAYLRPYIVQHSKKGSVPYITMPMLQGFKVPILVPSEQVRIVAILDKLDTLTTSFSNGLPREIELREKQYAYYRDQLLSFTNPGAEAV